MINFEFIYKTTCYSVTGALSGGILWMTVNDLYQMKIKKNNLKIKDFFEIQIKDLSNYGSIFGLFLGVAVGITGKPLIYNLVQT